MRSTKDSEQHGSFPNGMNQTIKKIIFSRTVKITDGGNFTGSGAIIKVQGNNVWVLTALHNLWVADGRDTSSGGLPSADTCPTKRQVYVRKFLNKSMRVVQDAAILARLNLQELNFGPNGIVTGVRFFTKRKAAASESNWNVDLCILDVKIGKKGSVENRNFIRTVKKINYEFAPCTISIKNLIRQNYSFIHLGFGRTTKADLYSAGKLNWRLASVTAPSGTPLLLAKDSDGYKQLLILDATANNTSLPGDSGGPLLAYKGDKLELIGITCGGEIQGTGVTNTTNCGVTCVTNDSLKILFNPASKNFYKLVANIERISKLP